MIDTAVAKVLAEGGERITGINGTTRDRVMDIVQREVHAGLEDGLSPMEIASRLEESLSSAKVFDQYRSELIARTETMMAYNSATLTTYSGYGVEKVQALDGDADEVCAARNLSVMTVLEAQVIQDHPNGTLAWVPVIGPAREKPGRTPPTVQAPRAPATPRLAPLPTPVEPPPYVPSLGTVRKPVSDAFRQPLSDLRANRMRWADPEAKKVAAKMDEALGTIDRTFLDGDLPVMPEVGPLKNAPLSVQGMYRPVYGGGPKALFLRGTADIDSAFHEIAHFIDHTVLGHHRLGVSQFGSQLGFSRIRGELTKTISGWEKDLRVYRAELAKGGMDWEVAGIRSAIRDVEQQIADVTYRADLMAPVAQAIENSRAYRALLRAAETGKSEVQGISITREITLNADQQRWVRYAIDPEEVFARAMAQYLAKRRGIGLADYDLLATRTLADQWSWADFTAIDDAITGMLRSAGWLSS